MSSTQFTGRRVLNHALRQLLNRPAFLIAALVLGVSAVGLNSAAGFLQLHFKKIAVPLRVRSLKEGLPSEIGTWVQVSSDQSIDSEQVQVLGTSEYVFRDYVNTASRKISRSDIDALKNASAGERARAVADFQQRDPSAVIRVAVTYYTGMVDTVAHIPERCMVADGFEVTQFADKELALGNYPNFRPRTVTLRFLSFADQTGAPDAAGHAGVRRIARNVGYVFHCNGGYENDAYGVRLRLQNLRERYGYYAKVELMTAAPVALSFQGDDNAAAAINDRNESLVAMRDFLAAGLPQLEKCLPDWEALHPAAPAKASAAR
ncbi:MAG: hypothetical protein JWN51_3533 [Phycisphaerales bacterium]|nr:hypothetical protein [Phycisphaerales bacterium]